MLRGSTDISGAVGSDLRRFGRWKCGEQRRPQLVINELGFVEDAQRRSVRPSGLGLKIGQGVGRLAAIGGEADTVGLTGGGVGAPVMIM
jgi:hypothetical protein